MELLGSSLRRINGKDVYVVRILHIHQNADSALWNDEEDDQVQFLFLRISTN